MLLVVVLIILNVYILLEMGKKPAAVVTSNEKWVVYGPWTVDGLVSN